MNKNLRERFMLEGAIGYIAHINQKIQNKEFKTVEEIYEKLNNDGMSASGALSLHLENALKNAGFATGLLEDIERKQENVEVK